MATAIDRPTTMTATPSGWVIFAITLTAMAGFHNLIYGLVLLFNSSWVAVTDDEVLLFDLTAWGWMLLGFGAVQLLTALGMISGQSWARVLGVIWASLVVVGQMTYLNVYPLWSIVIITLSVLVIYALTVHGDEVL